MDTILTRRLLFILQRGWVEARLLAQKNNTSQLFDLADAMEPIAAYMNDWKDDNLEAIRFNLTLYQEKYRTEHCFDYVVFLDKYELPERF